jgi:hypothetical protein
MPRSCERAKLRRGAFLLLYHSFFTSTKSSASRKTNRKAERSYLTQFAAILSFLPQQTRSACDTTTVGTAECLICKRDIIRFNSILSHDNTLSDKSYKTYIITML